MMKNTIKSILALALVALCGTAQAIKCVVNSVPNDVAGVWVTKTENNPPGENDYKTKDDSSVTSTKTVNFWAYHKICGAWEFLGWRENKDGTGDAFGNEQPYKCSADPLQTKTLYGYFHVHNFSVYEASGLTIILKCSNSDNKCKHSYIDMHTTKTATLVAADSKPFDGTPYTATVKMENDTTTIVNPKYYQADGTTEISAPTEIGSYVVKMTYGTVTVQKGFQITHAHSFSQDALTIANKTTWTCSTGDCPIPAPYVELVGEDKEYDGTAIAFSAVKSPNNFGELLPGVTVGTVEYWQGGTKLSGAPKYTGNYVAKVVAGKYTLEKAFSITKPTGGYSDGWEVGNTSSSVRYDSWNEAVGAAQDGDTIYYHNGDINQKVWEYSPGNKNLTLDMGGKTMTYTGSSSDTDSHPMSIVNNGSGTLTYQNVTIDQPVWKHYGTSWAHNVKVYGPLAFGAGVFVKNEAGSSDRYCTIESYGSLTVANGQYQCGFEKKDSGSVVITGGKFWEHDDPSDFVSDKGNTHFVKEISGDYKYEVVAHTHKFVYTANGAVVTCSCAGNDSTLCAWNKYTQTATLEAPNKEDDGKPYALAKITYTDAFPEQTGVITYWNGDEEIDAPTKFGSYTAKTTIGGATAVKAFSVIHVHNFEYDANQDAGTITARCTTTEDCDFNVNKRIATLTANNGTYTGFAQNLASVTKPSDFPADVTLAYSCGSAPVNVGTYTATMTVADKSVEKGFSIAKASMSNVAITLSGTSMDYTGKDQGVSIGSVKLGDYTLVKDVDYTVDESSVFSSSGSGAQDTTSTIKIVGKGNFADDAQTAEWTIKAPTRSFEGFSIPSDYAGTLSGTTVTMAGANWKYCAAGTAPDGNPDAGWYTCLQLDWPVANKQFTRPEVALHTLSTNPGEQFWGSALPENGNVLTVDADTALFSDIKYVNYTWWHVRMTPEIAEACEDTSFTRSMTACGLKWSKSDSLYGDSDGVREVTCTVTQPMTETVVLTVPMGAAYDLGATKLAKSALKLAKNAIVTTTVEQGEGKIFTEEDGYSVYCIKDGDVFKYVCWLATHYVTVPNVAHATKVVKVGDTVKEPTEAGGSVYAVFHGDTVTATYTLDEGYAFGSGEETGVRTLENVTEDKTVDAPVVNAIAYPIAYTLNGGENDPQNPPTYTIEDAVELKPATKRGYTFTGWDPAGVIAKGSTGEKAFAATWTPTVYKVEYVMSNGTNHADNPATYTVEQSVALKNPTRKGYEFTGWSPTNGIALGSIDNRTFYATWTATVYKVEFRDAVTEEAKAETMTYTIETASPLALPALPTPEPNYTVKGWLTNRLDVVGQEETSELDISEDMLGDKAFYVHFVFQTPVDPKKEDAAQVVIPQAVITNIVEDAETKTAEQISEDLNTADEKGVTKTERYVLQLKMDDVNDVPVIQPEQTADATKVRVHVGNIEPLPENVSNAKVRYSIETSSTPDFANPTHGDQQDSPTFDLPLPTSGVMYYRAKIDLVKPQ